MSDAIVTNDRAVSAPNSADRAWATPPVDVYENDDAFLVRADLPGVTSDGVEVRFEQDSLRIEAKRHLDSEADASWSYDFRRAFKLSGIDEDQITAEMKDGVLSLTLPKAASVRPRQIPVQAG